MKMKMEEEDFPPAGSWIKFSLIVAVTAVWLCAMVFLALAL